MQIQLEKVSPDLESSLRCLDWDQPDFDCPHHLHPEIEITQILSGEGERLVGDSLESFQPGEIFLFGSNLPHYFKNWRSERCHSRVIQFLPEVLQSGLSHLPEFNEINRLLEQATRGLRISHEIYVEADKVITKLFEARSGFARLLKLLELLNVLSHNKKHKSLASPDFQASDRPEHSQRLQRVLNYIENNWQEAIKLDAVAEVACLHPQSFSRYFKKHLRKTYQQYLSDLRISRAARMIMESDSTISFIAFECGFNNLANFNRSFKERYQCTPSKWRARFDD